MGIGNDYWARHRSAAQGCDFGTEQELWSRAGRGCVRQDVCTPLRDGVELELVLLASESCQYSGGLADLGFWTPPADASE